MSLLFRSVFLGAATVAGAGGVLLVPTAVQAQSRDTTFSIGRTALLDVTVRDGYLLVRGSSRTDGEVRTSGSGISIRSVGSGVVVGTGRDDARSGRSRIGRDRERDTDDARVEITVPRGVRVVISGGRADVEVDGIDGDVEVRATSSDIMLRRLGGRAIVETLSGDIVVSEGVNGFRATTSSGDIEVQGLRGNADVQTHSGDVNVSGTDVTRFVVETITGDVTLDGSVTEDARVQVSTHTGDVLLRLPERSRGELQFSTFNGEIHTSFPITTSAATPGITGRERQTGQGYTFGGGGAARISISTFNGDFRFERGSGRLIER
ncbi:MAG TPA: DUF4097 family beta strand repeat-containing protein [Gemmatimonas sp.]|nr:DUF4097 family beta strand repeat-containing protein [Gemmatimonas sp.]